MSLPSTDAITVVRAHFDDILSDHLQKIVDPDVLPGSVVLDIATITALVLVAEREMEVEQFPEAPPEFYTRESFVSDIKDVGLGADGEMMMGLDRLLGAGMAVQEGKVIRATATARKMLQVMNTLFPGMPGMNLVAYIVQTIEEVVSGRKELEEGKAFFQQTLQSRSLAGQVSELRKEKPETPKTGMMVNRPKKTVSPAANKALLQRLNKLRTKREPAKPELLKVKEIFAKEAPPEPAPETPPVVLEEVPEEMPDMAMGSSVPEKTPSSETDRGKEHSENLEAVDAISSQDPSEETEDLAGDMEPEEAVPPADETNSFITKENAEDEADTVSQEDESRDAETVASDPDQEGKPEEPAPLTPATVLEDAFPNEEAKGDLPAEEPADLAPPMDATPEMVSDEAPASPDPEEMKVQKDPEPAPLQETSDEDIEARIAAYEKELSMSCPVCKTGKIQTSETGKGKVFYDCSNSDCNFISWSQPFHYTCPTCENPFLIAFQTKDGKEGLKCPRATCDYVQDARINPEEFQKKKKKKRKVIRRVKRKK